ncbi:hypothetical protein CBL_07994 [Carabus blaptoides fortunei]
MNKTGLRQDYVRPEKGESLTTPNAEERGRRNKTMAMNLSKIVQKCLKLHDNIEEKVFGNERVICIQHQQQRPRWVDKGLVDAEQEEHTLPLVGCGVGSEIWRLQISLCAVVATATIGTHEEVTNYNWNEERRGAVRGKEASCLGSGVAAGVTERRARY